MRRPQKDVSEDALPWWKRETLMSRVDSIAKESPNKIYAAYPRSPLTYDEGFREITYSELANAVNGIAHLLKRLLPNDKPGQTLAYIGPNDIRYPALILGAAKLGHKVRVAITVNSAEYHQCLDRGSKVPTSVLWMASHVQIEPAVMQDTLSRARISLTLFVAAFDISPE